jgi:glycosyltransferase involved in cell wall biosynthesis
VRVILIGTGVRSIPPVGYGGIERTLAELSKALTDSGVTVELLNEVHPGRTGEYRFAARLRRRRGELEGAVLHASTPVVAARLRRMALPFVYTTHSRHWFSVSGITQRWGLRLEQRAVTSARRAIALTEVVRSRILDRLPPARRPHRIETIGLGVDLQRFAPRTPSGDPHIALGIGALLPLKRWDWAAQALEGTGIRLRLVGPSADPRYARHLAGLGSVELLGEVSDDVLCDELQRAGMLVHPSAAELFPGVVAQAMASGRPVIGMAPVASLVDDGETGFIVGSTNPNVETAAVALRTAALRLRDEDKLREEMGRAGRAKALREFDWRVVAQAHADLYARVASEIAH